MVLCRYLPTAFVLFFSVNVAADPFARAASVPELAQTQGKKITAANQKVDSGAFLAGIAARSRGDDSEAARALRAASQADPANRDMATQAFVLSVLAGSPEAVELARREEQFAGKEILSSFVLGNHAALNGDWQAAARYYQQGSQDPMAHLVLPLLLAWCDQAEHKTHAALDALSRIQGSVLSPFYTLHAALIAQLSGDSAEAGRLFAQAQHAMPGEDLLLARSYAAWCWQNGQRDKARELLRRMIDADPVLALAGKQFQAEVSKFPVDTSLQGLARAYVLTAFLFQQQLRNAEQEAMSPQAARQARFRLNEATRLMLSFALELDPHMSEALLMMAEVQQDEGHPQAARATLLRMPSRSPLMPVAAFKLALIDNESDHLDEARDKLLALVKDNPELVLPVSELGNTEASRKNWQGAFAAYDKAVNLSRAGAPLRGVKKEYWSLLFLRAVTSYELGNWPKAKADLKEALALQPDNPLLLNFLGYSMTEQHEDLAEAERLLRKAVELDPDDAAIRDSLGWVMVERGDLKEGTQLLERAVAQTPEDPEVNYHLGEVYWRMGRHREAVDHWNLALELKPEPRDEKLIRGALARAGNLPDKQASVSLSGLPAGK